MAASGYASRAGSIVKYAAERAGGQIFSDLTLNEFRQVFWQVGGKCSALLKHMRNTPLETLTPGQIPVLIKCMGTFMWISDPLQHAENHYAASICFHTG
jgi:alkyl hydroperoxide reductase subunit AhpF